MAGRRAADHERHQRLKEARRVLTRAAALSFEVDTDSLTQALLLAATGIMHLAAADTDGVIMDRALEVMARVKEKKGE